MLDGTAPEWRDWKVVTSWYTGACHDEGRRNRGPVINATLMNHESREASEQRAADNEGPGEELAAWRSLCRSLEPAKTRFVGVFLILLNLKLEFLWRHVRSHGSICKRLSKV